MNLRPTPTTYNYANLKAEEEYCRKIPGEIVKIVGGIVEILLTRLLMSVRNAGGHVLFMCNFKFG